ncbi:MAG TPA: BamA/TamA family outer membrane protein, partial [Ferruginibacter sp.]|nr:BamA/TamA family outer membrane protein [Ferruginibacter sp.]
KYSISQNAFSTTYKGNFTKILSRWDGVVYANYDFIRWTNFYGLGNDTRLVVEDVDYNRMRTRDYKGSLGLQQLLGLHKFSLTGFYQDIKIINDSGRYISKSVYPSLPVVYQDNNFVGADFVYTYQNINDSVLPVKGINFLAGINYTHNIHNSKRDFENFSGELNLFAPFTKNLGIAIKAGGATLAGTPEFYQYNFIGGTRSLRGYRRERFYGNSSFYNQNELRWISNVRSYLFNGKIGLFALYDAGRVWLKGENSNTWHTGYGGGILIAPFNRITLSVAYGISPEDKTIHLNILKVL